MQGIRKAFHFYVHGHMCVLEVNTKQLWRAKEETGAEGCSMLKRERERERERDENSISYSLHASLFPPRPYQCASDLLVGFKQILEKLDQYSTGRFGRRRGRKREKRAGGRNLEE